MHTFSHYVGATRDFTDFLGVPPRPARPEESAEISAKVYEVQIDPDLTLKAVHFQEVEGGDEDIAIQMLHKGKVVFEYSLCCVQIIVDKLPSSEVFLVLREGSTNLRIHKNPWRVCVKNSSYYEYTSEDDF